MAEHRFGLIAGRYQLRDQLGVGGMGRVWLAYDEMLGREVAIKEVAPRNELTPEESDELSRLILREARATARINHPHVVQIYDVIQTEEWPWIVMEYVPSLSLHRVIRHEGPLPAGEVAVIGLALLGALTAAHQAGILHRDVKPDNVLIGEDGRVVLTDFGLARFDADPLLTQTGRLGTPQYVAPERARLGVSSREADLWSLGATLYAAVEGRSPYARPTMMETLTALATQEPDPMQRGGALEPAVMGLLRRDPAERLTPELLERALKEVINGGPAVKSSRPSPPSRPPSHRRRGRRLAARSLAPVLVLALAVGLSGEPTSATATTSLGVMACDSPLRSANALPRNADGPPGQYALLPGWVWYRDPAGFSVAVPQHWRYWRARDAVCFRDPNGTRILAVGTGPVEPPGYELLFAEQIMLAEPAMEREFLYGGDERKRHAIALVTAAFTVLWASDDFDFQPSRAFYDVVKSSFRAGGHNGGG
jgi:serine/threonine protein kinase